MPTLEEITLPHTFECQRCCGEKHVEPSDIERPDVVKARTALRNFGWRLEDEGAVCGDCRGAFNTCSACGAQNSSHRVRCSQCHEPL